mmetsp:Transcript_72025/g.211011  ORF Transcript_72025/g.211011 Transcript_72025/m.211011 type:complete len:400 (+) Transcript_72025:447-1646(+)
MAMAFGQLLAVHGQQELEVGGLDKHGSLPQPVAEPLVEGARHVRRLQGGLVISPRIVDLREQLHRDRLIWQVLTLDEDAARQLCGSPSLVVAPHEEVGNRHAHVRAALAGLVPAVLEELQRLLRAAQPAVGLARQEVEPGLLDQRIGLAPGVASSHRHLQGLLERLEGLHHVVCLEVHLCSHMQAASSVRLGDALLLAECQRFLHRSKSALAVRILQPRHRQHLEAQRLLHAVAALAEALRPSLGHLHRLLGLLCLAIHRRQKCEAVCLPLAGVAELPPDAQRILGVLQALLRPVPPQVPARDGVELEALEPLRSFAAPYPQCPRRWQHAVLEGSIALPTRHGEVVQGLGLVGPLPDLLGERQGALGMPGGLPGGLGGGALRGELQEDAGDLVLGGRLA